MSDPIERKDVIHLIENTPYSWENLEERTEMINALKSLPSAEEQVWEIAQKCFHSTITYREAVDYVKELEEQHERFNQQTARTVDR